MIDVDIDIIISLFVLFVGIILLITIYIYIQKLKPKPKEKHPEKKKFKRCTDFRVIRKTIWKAFNQYYKPLIRQIHQLEKRKKELNEKIMKGENVDEEKEQLTKEIEKWIKKRENAAKNVFRIANSFIRHEDMIDLHGLFVGDALKIVKDLLPECKKNDKIKILRVSCGLGKHNGLGYSKITKSLCKMLKQCNIEFWVDNNIGFVKIDMKTVPDKIDYEIKSYNINCIFKEFEKDDKEVDFGENVDELKKED